jgi:thiol-disulfide isomerase/thioredoxin
MSLSSKNRSVAIFLVLIYLILPFVSVSTKYNDFICTSANAAHIKVVNQTQFIDVLENSHSYYQILFFFTSWCPHCKHTMHELLNAQQNTTSEVFFISLDKDYKQLSKMTKQLQKEVDIYYLNNVQSIIGLFEELKIHYTNTIPYIVVLNANGRIVDEDLSMKELYKYLHR